MIKDIKSMELKHKRVLIRCDLDVPLKNGKVMDAFRLEKAVPTIRLALKKGAKQVILAGHAGRPKAYDESVSFKPIAMKLSKLLGQKVVLHENLNEPASEKNKIILLENLRFDSGEKGLDKTFAKKLASFADVYVNNAFANSHRSHTSMTLLPKMMPCGVGLQVKEELKNLSLEKSKKPIVAIFGAAKINDKIPLVKSLLKKVDKLLIGGGVAFTFLKASGFEVGKSLVDEESLDSALKILKEYPEKIVLPVDFVANNKLDSTTKPVIVEVDNIPKLKACFDIGPKSVKLFKAVLESSKTVVWNGPLGVFEVKPYDKGTNEIAKYLGERNKMRKTSVIVGGGDTADAVDKYSKNFTHVSTGGGASLELLSGQKLPAINALERKNG